MLAATRLPKRDGTTREEASVRYGVSVPNFGGGVDARAIAESTLDAEDAGWDGYFLCDHLLAFSPGPVPVVDPWIALAAAALSTSTIRLGPMVTPLPRRRPVKLARESVSLDRLSGGRLVLGVGIGARPYEWDYLGEEADTRVRGAMLDEGLEVLTGLWSGEPFGHRGEHYRVAGNPPSSNGGPSSPLLRCSVPVSPSGWAVLGR
jgi:alkanesulfonate monooxygenase SsuD/methylene tetrahydromethanopterin reductase-like flavin-dependent oxidoreductase (luciferase family)